MKTYLLFLGLFFTISSLPIYAQSVTITPGQNAPVIEAKSPTQGTLLSRMTSAQRNAITNPVVGLLVYDTDFNTLFLYDGQNWLPLQIGNLSSIFPSVRYASDGVSNDFFGRSVAISGDYAIIGAGFDDIESHPDRGSAYIFVRSGGTWTEQVKLTANDGASYDYFGGSVAINGDYAIVGAKGDDIDSHLEQGSAYVFVRNGNTWLQQAKITASDGDSDDFFGASVGISGDYMIVGANSDVVGANTSQGSAYIFVRSGNTWTQQAQLTASDGTVNDFFGSSVAINGDYAIVGATGDDFGSNLEQGSAYVYVRSGTSWGQQAKLFASDGQANDTFGYSVAINEDYAIVGAIYDDIGDKSNQGSVYVFRRFGNSWGQFVQLTAPDRAAEDNFGSSVSISGDYIIVGAQGDDIGVNLNQGSAYLFKLNGAIWQFQRQITEQGGSSGNAFGSSISISPNDFVIGSPYNSTKNSNQGAVSFGRVGY